MSPADELVFPASPAPRVRVGIDTVHIPRLVDSLAQLGEAFERRLFTSAERAYADAAPLLKAQRLAARFAAKEAVIKALELPERGVSWQDIEVRREAGGRCELTLRGVASAAARAQGVVDASVSLSHDGDHAVAVVVCLLAGGHG